VRGDARIGENSLTNSFNRRDFLISSLVGASGLALAGGCQRNAPQGSLPVPDRVFLITIDTVRPDHLDFHGYIRATTPFLSGLASKGVVFENAYTTCNNTNPAHTGLFSGLHVPQHGVGYNGQNSLNELVHTLPETFHAKGYDTAGFASVVWMKLFGPRYGHFETYMGKYRDPNATRIPYFQANETIDNVLKWTNTKTANDKFLIWIHLYDPHDPYHPPENIRQALRPTLASERKRLLDYWTKTHKKDVNAFPWQGNAEQFIDDNCLYDAEMTFADRELGRLYAECGKRGLNKNSAWIITSDHGEGLGTHSYRGHGMNIYQEQMRVPLLVHTPDATLQPRRFADLVQHVDVLPMFEEWFQNPPRESKFEQQGTSLLPLLEGRIKSLPHRYLFAARRIRVPNNHSESWEPDPVYCILDDTRKYIHRTASSHEYYDLKNDPYEQKNLIDVDEPKKLEMKALGEAWYAKLKEQGGEMVVGEDINQDYVQDLEALGYLGTGGTGDN